jgi:glycosyltransferase involved in cell wall biosynthesis
VTPNHRVSIVIPTYNEEANLPACLASIQRQRFPALETIVVDNGSKDRTIEIAQQFGAIVLHDPGKEISGLRNLGVAAASGDIIAFVDADCVVDPDWISSAATYFDRPDVVLWGSPATPPENATWVQSTWYLLRKTPDDIQEVAWLESMNLWVRKELFLSMGGFCESLTTCEDVDFSYRLGTRGKIVSDRRIRVIHYGEAATVKAFVKKEIWRGQSNWQAIRNYGWRWRELPSALIPAHYGLLVPLSLAIQPFLRPDAWLLLPVALLLLPCAAAIVKLRRKRVSLAAGITLLVLLQFYFFSRTLAVFHQPRPRRAAVSRLARHA